MPRVNSSITSRARFSLGFPLWLSCASSQTSNAGSRTEARRSSPNGARAWRRNVSFCRRIRPRSLTFSTLVAKWLCHMSTSRSPSGSGAEEHAVDPPGLELSGIAGGTDGQGGGVLLEVFRHAPGARRAGEEPADTGLGAVGQVAADLVPRCGETGAAVKAYHAFEVPGRRRRRGHKVPRGREGQS